MALVERSCVVCATEFKVKADQLRKGRGKCCSLSCAASLAAASRRDQSGENNPNWKGGKKLSRDQYLADKRAYRASSPKKAEAHRLAYNAIRSKALIPKPCEVCGEDRVDAHHDDYDKPLDVRWLCRRHHMQFHAEND